MSKIAYLEIINEEGNACYRAKLAFKDGRHTSAIQLPDTLGTGHYALSAYTSWMKNDLSSIQIQKRITILNLFNTKTVRRMDSLFAEAPKASDAAGLQIQHLNSSYSERTPVALLVSSNSDLLVASVSVFKSDLGIPPAKDNFTLRPQLVQKERNVWQTDSVDFLPEPEGEIISGVASSKGRPLANQLLVLSYAGNHTDLAFATSDKNGRFRFVNERNGKIDLTIQPFRTDTSYAITLDQSYLNWTKQLTANDETVEQPGVKEINESFISEQLESVYAKIQPKEQGDTVPAQHSFYGHPSLRIFPDRYIEIPTFSELIKEIIPFLTTEENNNRTVFKLTVGEERKSTYTDILTFVDGVLINDVHRVLQLKPGQIQRIDLVDCNYYFEGRMLGPLVAIYTFKGNLSDLEFNPDLFRIIIDGPIASSPLNEGFYCSNMDSSSTLGDYRNLLLWKPLTNLASDKQLPLNFYTSDATGRYTIRIDAFNRSLKRITTIKEFAVTEE